MKMKVLFHIVLMSRKSGSIHPYSSICFKDVHKDRFSLPLRLDEMTARSGQQVLVDEETSRQATFALY